MNLTCADVARAGIGPPAKQSGAELLWKCPRHADDHPSLKVNTRKNAWLCGPCGSSGTAWALAAFLSSIDANEKPALLDWLHARNLLMDRLQRPDAAKQRSKSTIVSSYDYADENGEILYQVVRLSPKAFRQRHQLPDGSWSWSMEGVRRIPYRLPDWKNSERVFIVEGEKDADALHALGLPATTNPGGAGNWRDELDAHFAGKHVILLPDNDDPGRRHMAAVAARLKSIAASVRIVELPGLPPKGDVSDFLAAGGTLENLCSENGTANQDCSEIRTRDLTISALTHDTNGENWGRLVEWRDPRGKKHQALIPLTALAAEGNEYREALLHGGFPVPANRKAREELSNAILNALPGKFLTIVNRVGWHDQTFVLPDQIFGKPDHPFHFTQPVNAHALYATSGTLEQWQQSIAALCPGNSRLVLAVAAAFAGPLLTWSGGESGGIHFVGNTSCGKSTALMVGGSVCGGGGNNGFLQSWRSTANGLEAVAAMHNDGTLFLDELAQVEPQQASEIAYLLGNGIGKLRMTKSLAVRRPLTWNLLFLSAGEISLADHASTAGHRVKGGAEIRLLNVDADAGAGLGIFDAVPAGINSEAFSRKLKSAARKSYGTPLRAFLAWITENRAEAEKTLQTWHADFCQSSAPSGAAGEVIRAANRFGLIAAAGEIASLAKITGWKRGESAAAALRCFGDWLAARGHHGPRDIAEAIKQVWHFIHLHGASRFASENQPSERIQNRAGFIGKADDGATEYLIFPEVFRKEVCAGFDYRTVARALATREMLTSDGKNLALKRTLPELGRVRMFALRQKRENQ